LAKKATKWLVLSVLFYPVRVICQREKKRTVSQALYFCMKKKTLKKKGIDFRAMSDKILTRKGKRTDFQEGNK